jgi:amino acid permease
MVLLLLLLLLLLQGAGMMAIPRAFNLLGLLPGLAIMGLMACLTFFTLAGLISATAATQAGGSYGALVRKTVGGAADHALQLAVLANCYVMNV